MATNVPTPAGFTPRCQIQFNELGVAKQAWRPSTNDINQRPWFRPRVMAPRVKIGQCSGRARALTSLHVLGAR